MAPKKKVSGWKKLEPDELCAVKVTDLKGLDDAKDLILRLQIELQKALSQLAAVESAVHSSFETFNVARVVLQKAVSTYRHRSKKKVAAFEEWKSKVENEDEMFEFVRFPDEFVVELCPACVKANRYKT